MANVKLVDYQSVTKAVVQMWFKNFGIFFQVFGTKTHMKSPSLNLRENTRLLLQSYE